MDDVVRRVSRQQSSVDDILDEEIPPRPPETSPEQKTSPETPASSIKDLSKAKFSSIAKSVGRAKLTVNNFNKKKTRTPSPKLVSLP